MAYVNIASIFTGWDSGKSPCFTRCDSHHTTEWLVGDVNIWPELAGGLAYFVVVQVGLRKVVGQQTEARNDSVPAPALVFDADDIDYESIARFCILYIHRTGEWMNE